MADNLARKPDNENEEERYGWEPRIIEGEGQGDSQPAGNLSAVDTSDPEQVFAADESAEHKEGSLHSVNDMEKLPTPGKKKAKSKSKDSLYNGPETPAPGGVPGKLLKGIARVAKKHPKKAIGGGGVGGLLVALFLGFSVLQGPLQFVHAANLLTGFFQDANEEVADDRSGKLFRRHRIGSRGDGGRNLGFLGNRVANFYNGRLARNGITPRYDARNVIVGFEFDPGHPATRKNLAELERLGYNVNGNNVELQGTNARARRSAISQIFRTADTGKLSGAVGKRTMKARGRVDFAPLRNFRLNKRSNQSYDDFRQRVEEDRNRRILGGNDVEPPRFRGSEGDNVDGEQPDSVRQTNEYLDNIRNNPGRVKRAAKNLSDPGVETVLTGACIIGGISETYDLMKYSGIILPLARIGLGVVTVGSQIQTGGSVSLDEIGVLNDQFYDEDTNTSWLDSQAMQHELGRDTTGPNLPDTQKPSLKKPGLLRNSSRFTSLPGVGTYCDVTQHAIGGLVIDIADIVIGNVYSGIASAGLGWFFGDDIASFIANFIQTGEPVSPGAEGSLFGSQMAHGDRLAASDDFIGGGGRMLTNQEEQETRQKLRALNERDFQQQSFVARLFNVESPHSLGAQVAMGFRYNYSVPNITRTGLSGIASLFRLPADIVTNQAYAQEEEPFGYDFPRFGFTDDELEDPKFEDPYANEESLKSLLKSRRTSELMCWEEAVQKLINEQGMTRQQAIDYLNEPHRNQDGPHQREKTPDNIPNSCEINPSDWEEFYIEWGIPCFGTEVYSDASFKHYLAVSNNHDEAEYEGHNVPESDLTYFNKKLGTRPYEDEDYRARDKILKGNGGHPSEDKIYGCDGGDDGPNGNWSEDDSNEGDYRSTRGPGGVDDLIRYRFYMADIKAASSVACLDGDAISCSNIGMNSSGSSQSSASTGNTLEGLRSPPNLGSPDANGYYKFPDAQDGEYIFNGGSPPSQRCGSKELVDLTYTLAMRWHETYGTALMIGDLNASGHLSHRKGVDVDIYGPDRAVPMTEHDKAIQLGKWAHDSGIVKDIYYNYSQVQDPVNTYAGDPNFMFSQAGHEDHFHIRLLDQYEGVTSESCS